MLAPSCSCPGPKSSSMYRSSVERAFGGISVCREEGVPGMWIKPRFSSNIEGKLSRGKFNSLNAADMPMRLPEGTFKLSAGTIELPQLQQTNRSPRGPLFTGVHILRRSPATEDVGRLSLTLELRTAAIAFSRSLPQEWRKGAAVGPFVGVTQPEGGCANSSSTMNELGREGAGLVPMSEARREIFRMLTVTRVVSLVLRALPGCACVGLLSLSSPGRSVLDTMLSRYTVR
uniref:(northern house mosquito) hypothetical protein n=1 Tax=Culex pipiens TaxID=7175 RepID=A0A8D8KY84_CULPI